MTTLTEAEVDVEEAAVGWLEGVGWAYCPWPGHRPGFLLPACLTDSHSLL